MKRCALALLALLLVLPSGLFAQAWDTALPVALDKMADDYYMPVIQTVFGTFTYEYTDLTSPFSRWLEETLGTAMVKSGHLKLINKAAAAAMDPAYAKEYKEFFDKAEGGALLHGRYFDEGDCVRVRLELTGFADRTLIGVQEFKVPRGAVPRSLAVDPSKQSVKTADELREVAAPAKAEPGALKVSIATERGAGGVYRDGEYMAILAAANKDCYAKIYHVDAQGSVKLIWPNQFGGAGRLKGGETLRIPGAADAFAFKMEPPYGDEFLKIVASTTPFAFCEEDFVDLGKDARQIISRGVCLERGYNAGAVKPETAEAMASYVIIEKR